MSWYSSTVNQRYCARMASAMSGRSPIRAIIASSTSSKSIAPACDFTSWYAEMTRATPGRSMRLSPDPTGSRPAAAAAVA